MERIAHTLARLGRERELAAYLEQVRAQHRRKRTLLSLLDGMAAVRAA